MPHVLNWLYAAISWVLLRWHDLFSQFLDPNAGVTWALSIMFLVVSLRLLLFPLFVKQIHSMTAMQKMQPQVQEIKRKYKDDRNAQARAMMELQKEHGANPLGGCLPMVAQIPVFISLYHVLRHLQPGRDKTLYGWSEHQFDSAVDAKFFGAPLPASFRSKTEILHQLGATATDTRIVIVVLLLVSCVATFTTQRSSYKRSQAQGTMEPQQAAIQKFMLYVLPIGLLFSGLVFAFPLGVLLYWVTNNIWTMGQQFYIFERMKKKEAAEAAATPIVDTKALAPKPGQKPAQQKNARTRPATRPNPTTTAALAEASDGGATSSSSSRPAGSSGGSGAPGRRPQGNKRPTANRPNRKKKRR